MAMEKSPPFSAKVLPILPLLLINTGMMTALPSTRLSPNRNTAGVSKKLTNFTPEMPSEGGYIINCPGGHYFGGEGNLCHPCSSCPINQIIRTPCSALADTLCGPFVEFDTFNQSPAKSAPRELEGGSRKDHVQEPALDSSPTSPQPGLSLLRAVMDNGNTLAVLIVACLGALILLTTLTVILCIGRRRPPPPPQYLGVWEQEEIYGLKPEPRHFEQPDNSSQDESTSSCYQTTVKGCDMSKLLPLTPRGCDIKTDKPAAPPERNEHLYVYINPQALETSESS